MRNAFNIFEKILNVLARRPEKKHNLDDLTALVISDLSKPRDVNLLILKEKESEILDALIILNKEGLILLDSDADESIITIEGLISLSFTSQN